MNVTHDGKLLIAVGRSRKASQWQNKEMLWSEFLDKLATTTRTRETVAEYAALPKGERDTIKDVGGFVGGYLKSGKRNNASVVNRCMLCLDADNADPGLMDDLDMTFINAYALYSTHSHTPEKMRLRLIIPLTRTVTPDEYAAVSRRVADDVGLERFPDLSDRHGIALGNDEGAAVLSFSYWAAISGRSGRGPTMLISPLRMLISWGSSSKRIARMMRPTGVMRSSWSLARRATPSFSASTRIDLNFDLWFWR